MSIPAEKTLMKIDTLDPGQARAVREMLHVVLGEPLSHAGMHRMWKALGHLVGGEPYMMPDDPGPVFWVERDVFDQKTIVWEEDKGQVRVMDMESVDNMLAQRIPNEEWRNLQVRPFSSHKNLVDVLPQSLA